MTANKIRSNTRPPVGGHLEKLRKIFLPSLQPALLDEKGLLRANKRPNEAVANLNCDFRCRYWVFILNDLQGLKRELPPDFGIGRSGSLFKPGR